LTGANDAAAGDLSRHGSAQLHRPHPIALPKSPSEVTGIGKPGSSRYLADGQIPQARVEKHALGVLESQFHEQIDESSACAAERQEQQAAGNPVLSCNRIGSQIWFLKALAQ
jgi:hypothetical protein